MKTPKRPTPRRSKVLRKVKCFKRGCRVIYLAREREHVSRYRCPEHA